MISKMNDLWTRWYEQKGLKNVESRSGDTSTLRSTTNLRKELPRLLHKFDVGTLFDAPCGDMNWMRAVLKDVEINYIGGDIVAPMMEQLKSDPELSQRAKFVTLDLTRDPFPSADLMLARDFLFHLSFEHTLAFLRNFVSSNIRYLLTTSHINEGTFENRDITTGQFRRIDLFEPPYNFPRDTLDQILDGMNDRYLYLWTRAQIADAYEKFGHPSGAGGHEAESAADRATV
jgi:hypothetical protein